MMVWEIILSIIATICGSSSIGVAIKSILHSHKTKREFVKSENSNKEALHKIELQLTEISAKVDLVIKFSNKNTNTNEIHINEKKMKKGRKNCE